MSKSLDARPEQPIQVGDLVQVVKLPRCGCIGPLFGATRTVQRLYQTKAECTTCTTKDAFPQFYAELDGPSPSRFWGWHVETYRLKRIPPLEELEGQRTEEKLHEPA